MGVSSLREVPINTTSKGTLQKRHALGSLVPQGFVPDSFARFPFGVPAHQPEKGTFSKTRIQKEMAPLASRGQGQDKVTKVPGA